MRSRATGECQSWDLFDPGDVLRQLDARIPLVPGRVVVGVLPVADGGSRNVTRAVELHPPGPHPDQDEASHRILDVAEELAGLRSAGPPTQVFVTAVCRLGPVIDSPNEWFWFYAWWYANHVADAFLGDIYVVTEHGWTGVMDRRAGYQPVVREHSDRHLTVVRPDSVASANPPQPLQDSG